MFKVFLADKSCRGTEKDCCCPGTYQGCWINGTWLNTFHCENNLLRSMRTKLPMGFGFGEDSRIHGVWILVILAVLKAIQTPKFRLVGRIIWPFIWPINKGQFSFILFNRYEFGRLDIFISIVMLFRCTETFPNEICFTKMSKEISKALSSYFIGTNLNFLYVRFWSSHLC